MGVGNPARLVEIIRAMSRDMTRQVLIPASLEAESSFDSYWVGDNSGGNPGSNPNGNPNSNHELLAEFQQIVRGTRPRRVLYFWGEAGVGKTHLLNACCQLAGALQKPHAYLPVAGPQPDLSQLERIAPDALLCVDDFHAAATSDSWQAALFGLYEKLLGHAGAMVVGANQPIGALNLGLKDLESRLVSGGVRKLVPLSEQDKLAALASRARQKGFELSDQVLQFITTYYRRDTASLFSLLERIDNASLAEQRKITVPFIKSLL